MLTKAPNALISPLHDRMPVILPDGLQEAWLAQTAGAGLRALQPLLAGRDPEGCQTLPPGGGERGPGGSVGPAALRRHYS
jgi:putative SOS response-associated peptidase YedK